MKPSYHATSAYKAISWVTFTVVTLLTFSLGCVCAAQQNSGYSAAALYNHANALARDGKSGQAILFYERARLLAPNDPDIAVNERFVKSQSGLSDTPVRLIQRIFDGASPNAFAWLGVVGLLLSGVSCLLFRHFPNRSALLCASAIAGTVLVFTSIGSAVTAYPWVNKAVVIENDTSARVAPTATAEISFKLREGECVVVKADGPNFALVSDSTGRVGWVNRSNVARVIPQSSVPLKSKATL